MATENHLLGAHISLLSKAEIRYEGTLHSIDMEKATITLQDGACCEDASVERFNADQLCRLRDSV